MSTEKCKSCKFYQKPGPNHSFGAGQCLQSEVATRLGKKGLRGFHTIDFAIVICNPKRNGSFVYFEPKCGPSIGIELGENERQRTVVNGNVSP